MRWLSSLPPRLHSLVMGAIGVVGVVAIWWVIAASVPRSRHIPTPWAVVHATVENGWGFYHPVFSVTIREALKGGSIGVVLALILSAVVLLAPFAEPVIMQLAVVTYCIPIVAIAPVLIIINDPPMEPGKTLATAVDLAAISVFFTTVVGAVLGFKSADRASLDVVSVYGGGRLQQLVRVRLVAAVPAILNALQLAAPAAFLGALLGEFFDSRLELGVGPALVQSQQGLDSATAWSLGLGCALVAGVGYGFFGLLGRLVTPWARGAGQ